MMCLRCGGEQGEMTTWRDADGEGHWMHPECLPRNECRHWVGPVWKDGGETCVCVLDPGHALPHRCSCGATFEGCGHPAGEVGR